MWSENCCRMMKDYDPHEPATIWEPGLLYVIMPALWIKGSGWWHQYYSLPDHDRCHVPIPTRIMIATPEPVQGHGYTVLCLS